MRVSLADEIAYHRGMATFLARLGYLALAESHRMEAFELSQKRGKVN